MINIKVLEGFWFILGGSGRFEQRAFSIGSLRGYLACQEVLK